MAMALLNGLLVYHPNEDIAHSRGASLGQLRVSHLCPGPTRFPKFPKGKDGKSGFEPGNSGPPFPPLVHPWNLCTKIPEGKAVGLIGVSKERLEGTHPNHFGHQNFHLLEVSLRQGRAGCGFSGVGMRFNMIKVPWLWSWKRKIHLKKKIFKIKMRCAAKA